MSASNGASRSSGSGNARMVSNSVAPGRLPAMTSARRGSSSCSTAGAIRLPTSDLCAPAASSSATVMSRSAPGSVIMRWPLAISISDASVHGPVSWTFTRSTLPAQSSSRMSRSRSSMSRYIARVVGRGATRHPRGPRSTGMSSSAAVRPIASAPMPRAGSCGTCGNGVSERMMSAASAKSAGVAPGTGPRPNAVGGVFCTACIVPDAIGVSFVV